MSSQGLLAPGSSLLAPDSCFPSLLLLRHQCDYGIAIRREVLAQDVMDVFARQRLGALLAVDNPGWIPSVQVEGLERVEPVPVLTHRRLEIALFSLLDLLHVL